MGEKSKSKFKSRTKSKSRSKTKTKPKTSGPTASSRGTAAATKTGTGGSPGLQGRSVGIFTSGGDSCGMNACVDALVNYGLHLGARMFLIHEGYAGMIDTDPSHKTILPASWETVQGISHQGGTLIGSARCKKFREPEGRLLAAENLLRHKITDLVCIGGDGSLTGLNILRAEWSGLVDKLLQGGKISQEVAAAHRRLRIVGLIGSIDNDFTGSDMTIGADSALHRIVQVSDWLTTTLNSHQRVAVIEAMGRDCGYLAVVAGLGVEASFTFIPEDPPGGPREGAAAEGETSSSNPTEKNGGTNTSTGWQEKICNKLKKERAAGKRFNIVLVSEGAKDRQGNKISSDSICKTIQDGTGYETRVTVLGHPQRGGPPSAYDRWMPTWMAGAALELLMRPAPVTSPNAESDSAYVVCLQNNRLVALDLKQSVADTQAVAADIKVQNFDGALQRRGGSFVKNWQMTRYHMRMDPPRRACPQDLSSEGKLHPRIGICVVGRQPAAGTNSAIRSAVHRIIGCCGTPLLVHGGLAGLLAAAASLEKNDGGSKHLEELTWAAAANISHRGGSIAGRSSEIPKGLSSSLGPAAKKLGLNGLLLIGDLDAYQAAAAVAKDLKGGVKDLAVALIPAAKENNVPGTDFSLGADSALNDIVSCLDRCLYSVSPRNAPSTVFLILTDGSSSSTPASGGGTGLSSGDYLAVMSAVCLRAHACYVASQPKNYNLAQDVAALKKKSASTVYPGIVVTNDSKRLEEIRKAYGAGGFQVIVKNVTGWDVGAIPSPFDRALGLKMGDIASEWLIQKIRGSHSGTSGTGSGTGSEAGGGGGEIGLLGLHGYNLDVKPISQVVETKEKFWEHFYKFISMVANRNTLGGEGGSAGNSAGSGIGWRVKIEVKGNIGTEKNGGAAKSSSIPNSNSNQTNGPKN